MLASLLSCQISKRRWKLSSRSMFWGRPAGVAVGANGSLFVTDDASNSIWRVKYVGHSGRPALSCTKIHLDFLTNQLVQLLTIPTDWYQNADSRSETRIENQTSAGCD